MYGEGNYALTDVKEIETTEAFLNLDEEIKDCQNLETYELCRANEYRIGLKSCNCTPYALRNYTTMVSKKLSYYIRTKLIRNLSAPPTSLSNNA